MKKVKKVKSEYQNLIDSNPLNSHWILDLKIQSLREGLNYIGVGVKNGRLCPIMGDINSYEFIFEVKF